jgi:hypothetical protein
MPQCVTLRIKRTLNISDVKNPERLSPVCSGTKSLYTGLSMRILVNCKDSRLESSVIVMVNCFELAYLKFEYAGTRGRKRTHSIPNQTRQCCSLTRQGMYTVLEKNFG